MKEGGNISAPIAKQKEEGGLDVFPLLFFSDTQCIPNSLRAEFDKWLVLLKQMPC